MIRAWVAFEPLLFRDILLRLLRELDEVTVVEDPAEGFEVGIFRLAETGQLQNFFRSNLYPQSRLIVLSAHGEQAYIRNPGDNRWRKEAPFGIPELISAVLA